MVVKAEEKHCGSQGRWLLNDTPTGPQGEDPLPGIQRGRCQGTGEGSESHDGARVPAAGQPSSTGDRQVSVQGDFWQSYRAKNKSEHLDLVCMEGI